MLEMASLDDSSESDFDEVKEETLIRDFEAEGQLIVNKLLPVKSCESYEIVYGAFMKWHHDNKLSSFGESVLRDYFDELSKKLKPSSLWSRWSMLKTTLHIKHGIKINDYHRLKAFLKNFSKGYKPKKAKVLTWSQINHFLNLSDDTIYLAMKVILIFGIHGSLRCKEFCGINTTDVEDTGSQYIVTIKDSINYHPRTFVIGPQFYDKVKQYILLRPKDMDTNRFFVGYRMGKCNRQVIGKNKISEIPKVIALNLNLKNSEQYTGRSFRRTGATLLPNSGASLISAKSLGGWKLDSVVQAGCVENSLANERNIFEGIDSSDQSASVNVYESTKTSNITKLPMITSTITEVTNSLADSFETPEITNNEIDVHLPESSYQNSRISIKRKVVEEIPSSCERNIENDVFDEVCIGSSVVKFENCQINQAMPSHQNSNESFKKRRAVEEISRSCEHDSENDVHDTSHPRSSIVKFQNCQINHLTINNYSCSHSNEKADELLETN